MVQNIRRVASFFYQYILRTHVRAGNRWQKLSKKDCCAVNQMLRTVCVYYEQNIQLTSSRRNSGARQQCNVEISIS